MKRILQITLLTVFILSLGFPAPASPPIPQILPNVAKITSGTITGATVTVSDYIFFSIDAGIDGAAAPSAAVVTSSTNKVVTRDFPATADKDLFFNWQPPSDWD